MDALQGIAGELLIAVEGKTEGDPAAILAQFLTAFGNLVGRRHGAQVERTRHYPSLWVAVVGDTAKARKGTSWGVVNSLLAQVDPEWAAECVGGGLSSGEGILYRVRDEKGEDVGVSDKRFLVIEEELASVFRVARRESNTLSQVLRRLWDSGRANIVTKLNAVEVTGAHINVVGHIVQSELLRELSEIDAANGLGNRFLFIAATRSALLPDGAGIDEEDERRLIARVRAAYQWAQSQEPITFKRDAEATELWHQVYEELGDVQDTMAGALTSRAEAQVLRLSIVYALLDKSTEIRIEHLRAALEVWRYAEQSAYMVFGGRSGSSKRDRLLTAINDAGDAGLSRESLYDEFGRHVKARQLDDLLGDLEEHGAILRVTLPTGGRPRTVYMVNGRREESEEAKKGGAK